MSSGDADVILGCFPLSNNEGNHYAKYKTPEAGQEYLNVWRKAGYTHLDNARSYGRGTCEELTGRTDIAEWAVIDTKVQSFWAGSHKASEVEKNLATSVKLLSPAKINIMYLHGPDRATAFAEPLEAIDKGHKAGQFKHFGISNYKPEEVEEILELCEKNGWIKPIVYQGQYNAVCRIHETELFPILRKHNMAYYAYSPSAAGIFTAKHSATATAAIGTRFDRTNFIGNMYADMYMKPEILSAAAKVHVVAVEKYGLERGGHEVALRWVLHHSALNGSRGDKMIIGASSIEQLEENIAACKAGPLPQELVEEVERTWEAAKDVAPYAYR